MLTTISCNVIAGQEVYCVQYNISSHDENIISNALKGFSWICQSALPFSINSATVARGLCLRLQLNPLGLNRDELQY